MSVLQSVHRKIIDDSQFEKLTIHLFFIFTPLFKIIILFKSETIGGIRDETETSISSYSHGNYLFRLDPFDRLRYSKGPS